MPRVGSLLSRWSDRLSPERAYLPLLKGTAWIAGLLIAFVFGMLSAYLVMSAVYFGSRSLARIRDRAIHDVLRGD